MPRSPDPDRESAPADRSPSEPAAGRARSGDFSRDPTFDPEQLFEVIGSDESQGHVSDAMRAFLARQDVAAFEHAVAVFVRSARARGQPVERVLAVLIELADAREGSAYPHDWTLTDLRWLVLRAVLLAFYGDTDVASPRSDTERRGGGDRRHADRQPSTDDRAEQR